MERKSAVQLFSEKVGTIFYRREIKTVWSDSATPSNLNASNFLTVKDNNVESYSWNAQLESDPKHTRHAKLSLMVKKLDTIKLYEIAESGNTGYRASSRGVKGWLPCPCAIGVHRLCIPLVPRTCWSPRFSYCNSSRISYLREIWANQDGACMKLYRDTSGKDMQLNWVFEVLSDAS